MNILGINSTFLIVQALVAILFIGLPIISLIDLAKSKLRSTPLALWVLIICAVPLLGAVAYWIVKPTAEGKV